MKDEYSVELGPNHGIKVKIKTVKENDSDSSTFGYTEVEVGSQLVPSLGRYRTEYELYEHNPLGTTKNSVSVISEFKDRWETATMDTVSGNQSAVGIALIANVSTSIVQNYTNHYQNPTEWCWAQNQVVYTATTSTGFTLGGVISFAVTSGQSWTQTAMIKSSAAGIIHKYAAIYN